VTSDGSNSLSFVHALVLTLVGTLVVVVDAMRVRASTDHGSLSTLRRA
jgi:hypothetical protein